MPVAIPHGPAHEEEEFWYDTQEKALLYEVNIVPGLEQAEPNHSRTRERGHSIGVQPFHHHYQPHGICFADQTINESQRKTIVDNTELLIRLWCQLQDREQPIKPRFREPLIPVPKPLALFLAGKRFEMYKSESFTQALILLQCQVSSKAAYKCP